jgi:hypothetical protein
MNFVHKLNKKTALDALGELAQKDSTEATVSGRRHGAGLAQSFAARNEPELFGHTKYRGEKAAKQYNSSRKIPLSNKGSRASAREPEVDQQRHRERLLQKSCRL